MSVMNKGNIGADKDKINKQKEVTTRQPIYDTFTDDLLTEH